HISYLSRSTDPRYLLSFPTRRSSDLPQNTILHYSQLSLLLFQLNLPKPSFLAIPILLLKSHFLQNLLQPSDQIVPDKIAWISRYHLLQLIYFLDASKYSLLKKKNFLIPEYLICKIGMTIMIP